MKVLALFSTLLAFGAASPAPRFKASRNLDQWEKRQSTTPAYQAHTIDQPVCQSFFCALVSRLTIYRLTISHKPRAMSLTPRTHSNNAISSIRLTISLVGQYFCTLEGRLAARVDSLIYRQEVSLTTWISTKRTKLIICKVIQILMQQFNGLGVILENRYYGESFPFNTSTTDELRFLTTEQSTEIGPKPARELT